jgi:hypothetical protein
VRPERPLSELPAFQKPRIVTWEEQGIFDILDLPEDAGLSELQERVRQCLRTGEAFRGADLGAVLREPCYPIHHLDFEAFMPAIPRSVLPALVPGMSYEGLEIGNGGVAQLEYTKMIESANPLEAARIRSALLEYCGQDTLALVKLRQALEQEAGALASGRSIV